jgi:hypothetical protein
MSELSECLSWTGKRVWVRESDDASPLIGTIVHAFPTPFHRDRIDLAVRLRNGGFTVVAADDRGIQWGFDDEGWSKRVA